LPLAVAGALATALVVIGALSGRPGWIAPGLVLLGAEYTISLFLPDEGVDGAAPLYAAGFVLVAELAFWSCELRTPIPAEPGILARRAVLVTAIAVAALPAGALVLAATAIRVGGGVGLDAVGVLAAAAALLLVARLARSS
jgi:hypothetical protein